MWKYRRIIGRMDRRKYTNCVPKKTRANGNSTSVAGRIVGDHVENTKINSISKFDI